MGDVLLLVFTRLRREKRKRWDRFGILEAGRLLALRAGIIWRTDGLEYRVLRTPLEIVRNSLIRQDGQPL